MSNFLNRASEGKTKAIDNLKIGEYGSASNHYFSAVYEVAQTLDVDVDLIAQQVGLTKLALNRPDLRVPTEKLALFQNVIWDTLNDESMGANSRPIPSGTYFMMGKLTVQEENLGQALKLGAKFYNLMLQRQFVVLKIEGDYAILSVTLDAPDFKFLFSEMCLLAWHRYASWLISDVLPLHETRFPYSPPAHVSEYNYLFPGIHKFSDKQLAIVFPKRYLDREIKQNRASLNMFMNRCPLELFKQYKSDYSLSSEVKQLIEKGLSFGSATVDYCASELHMTPRTMIRKLKDEGTSFQKVKDVIRRDKAIYLLTEKSQSINEIAERVGYSDPAVFTRAFKNWTGETPKAFRTKLITK